MATDYKRLEFGEQSVSTICPGCNKQITTITVKRNGKLAFLASGIVCLLGGCLGCFLIPLFLPPLQDTVHLCPVCDSQIGKKEAL